jgi:hypothetical protein
MENCPKCGSELEEASLEEDAGEDMTEGQQADYDAGFNHTFYCTRPGCNFSGEFDVGIADFDEEELDELADLIAISSDTVEDAIENALKNGSYVEAISLIHNVIEAYLKFRLEKHFALGENKLKQLKARKVRINYLHDYTTINYLLGLISTEDLDMILQFNKDRNKVIHKILLKRMTLTTLKAIARKGREVQLRLSPLNHSPGDIKGILEYFDKITPA